MGEEKRLNIYAKLQQARVEINKQPIPKSGQNDFANGYMYHELGDFMPFVIEACNNARITPLFTYFTEADLEGKEHEKAMIELFDWDDDKTIRISSRAAGFDNAKMKKIQELGSRQTFMKRYLYMHMFEISEKSPVEIIQEIENVKENIDDSKKKIDDRHDGKKPYEKERIISVQQLIAIGKANGYTEEDIVNKHNDRKNVDYQVKEVKDIKNEDRIAYYDKMKG